MKGLMQDWPLVVPSVLDHAAREHGEQIVVTRGLEGAIRRSTLRDLHGRSLRVAKALDTLGIRLGDRVATMAWNTDRHLEVWYGVMGIGAVCHTLNPRLFADQLVYIINHAEDRVLFVDAAFVPVIEAIRDQLPPLERIFVLTDAEHLPASDLSLGPYEEWLAAFDQDFAWKTFDEQTAAGLCYTSGTTGNPKGVLYSHRSNVLHTLAINQPDVLGVRAMDTVMPVVPMFHANAWGLVFAVPAAGGKLVLPGAQMDGARLYELLDQEQVSITAAVPTVWMLLLEHLDTTGKKLPYLQRVVIGGAACPPIMIERFERDFGVKVAHAWGMTEMSPLGTLHAPKPGRGQAALGTEIGHKCKQGRAPYTVEMKITDDEGTELPRDGETYGHLMVRGPAVA
jgi:fatty-acyl-CoA synthase